MLLLLIDILNDMYQLVSFMSVQRVPTELATLNRLMIPLLIHVLIRLLGAALCPITKAAIGYCAAIECREVERWIYIQRGSNTHFKRHRNLNVIDYL